MNISFKRVGVVAGAIGAVLMVGVAWISLGLPVVALTTDVAQVEKFSKGTREMVLNNDWFRITADIERVERKLGQKPNDEELLFTLRLLREQRRKIELQMEELKK